MCKKVEPVKQTFGRLTILEKIREGKRSYYDCVCACGNSKRIRADSVVSGVVKSCGCLKDETTKKTHTKHGSSGDRLYHIWKNMKARCYNKNHTSFDRYGGRGIVICEDWLADYMNFKEWSLANGYTDHLSIDRENYDGNYTPTNCRWVDQKTQMNNTSRNRNIEYLGRTQSLMEWCRELDYNYNTTYAMLSRGDKTIKEIFTRPHIGCGFKEKKQRK